MKDPPIQPIRRTTLKSYTRRTRSAKAARRRAIALFIVALAAVAVVFVATGWYRSSSERTAATPLTAHLEVVGVERAVTASATPTPFFARYRDLHLYLPIDPQSLTALAFHQASGDTALSLDSLLPDADMNLAAETRRPQRVRVSTAETGQAVLEGEVLRMWRTNRSGPPDTAADVGAAPGTIVLAPVSGKVTGVIRYQLYGADEDHEIHIQPFGRPDLCVVLIHIDEPSVERGDAVVGGITPIARVRLLSDKIDHQLGGYTTCGGDHVHIQVNSAATCPKTP